MTDTTTVPADLLTALQAQLAATQPKPVTGWTQPAPAIAIQGVAVPIKMSTPKGEIRLYLQLPAECAASPDAIMQALQALDAQGMPLDVWQPRDSGGWNRGGNGGWSGGGYGRGGGWRR